MPSAMLGGEIKRWALEIGFDLVGIAPVDAGNDLEFARQWVERGFAGKMEYLANPKRNDLRLVLPSVKSVICVGLLYDTEHPYSTEVCGPEGRKQKAVGSGQKTGVRRQKSEVRSEKAESSETSLRIPQPSSLGRGWPARGGTGAGARPRAWISRYAWGEDYHDVVRARLEKLRDAINKLAPGVETRVFVDTGPIVERALTRFSGIGWMGKNTCIINEGKGSWFFLGVILTNLELTPDLPAPDRCGSCTACLEACPTGALVEPYVMDASRCISYLTIELKGSIPEEHRAALGANIFGCDICQDVCPWNNKRPLPVVRGQLSAGAGPVLLAGDQSLSRVGGQGGRASKAKRASGPKGREKVAQGVSPGEKARDELSSPLSLQGEGLGVRAVATAPTHEFQPMTVSLQRVFLEDRSPSGNPTTDYGQGITDETQFSLFNPPLDALASLAEEDFYLLFAHSPLKRAKYQGWLRNLCVAMGNSGDRRSIPRLEGLSRQADPVVSEHARWALDRLGKA